MSKMFQYCSLLNEIDIYHFDTRNVKDMSSMFYSCNNLRSLDISNFNTEESSWYFNYV